MQKLIKNKYANFYLNAASKLGLEYVILNEKVGLARIFNNATELDISSNILGVNTQISSSLSVNKSKTSLLLQEENLPTPSFKIFTNQQRAVDYASDHLQNGTLVVIKPLSGSLSIGITVNPSTVSQIKKAVAEAFEGNSIIMIEEYIPGRHFRITVFDDEIIAVTERIAANVTSNGTSSIEQLIIEKNKERRKLELPPIHLRMKDLHYLKKEKIELSKVYPSGCNIILQLGCDLDIGGERVRIERELIHPDNSELFKNAAKVLGLRFAGIDYISPDILLSHKTIKTAINEINSAPDSDVHYRDTYPNDNYAAERIVEKIFNTKVVFVKENTLTLPFTQFLTRVTKKISDIQIN